MTARIAATSALVVCSLFCSVGTHSARASLPAPTVAIPGLTAPPPGSSVSTRGPSASNAGDHGEDIRDIHGPINIPRRLSLWWYLGGVGGVVVVGSGALLYLRRGKTLAPPHERALRALVELRSSPRSDPRTFSFAVSEIVRRYIEEAFPVRAEHRTTEELLVDLMGDTSPISAHRTEIGAFLSHCDLAKFGGWSLSDSDMSALLASAETLVVATAPAPATSRAHGAAVCSEGVA